MAHNQLDFYKGNHADMPGLASAEGEPLWAKDARSLHVIDSAGNPVHVGGFDRLAKSGAYTIAAKDRAKIVDCTSGTFTLALTAAATLGSGFSVGVFNSGSGTITVDPAGSETIRTASGTSTTLALTQGQSLILECDGSGWLALVSPATAITPAALTKNDDTNVTLTLGGTPATALLQATSITVGWTGTLAVGRGGTGASTLTNHGVLVGQSTSAITATAAGTAGQVLTSGGASADPAWDYRGVPTGATIELAYAVGSLAGCLPQDGAAVSRTTYADLFALLGTTWGAGDGSTTFNVPDRRGRGSIGSGTGSGLTARTVGQSGGSESVTLTSAQSGLPAHAHNTPTVLSSSSGTTSLLDSTRALNNSQFSAIPTQANAAADAVDSHPNMQPFAVYSVWIKT